MNIYQSIYDLINTYIFGGAIQPATNQELVAILFSTCATLFLIALPFFIVWKVCKLIIGG